MILIALSIIFIIYYVIILFIHWISDKIKEGKKYDNYRTRFKRLMNQP